jgi:eukaryotic-like serine/threonine-protein kinase
VAALEHPDKPQHVRTVASVWAPDGTLRATVLHRAEGPLGGGHFQVAASPRARRTAFHSADGALTWWDPVAGPKPFGADVGRGTYFDLSLDPVGRAWSLEGGNRLGVREAGSAAPVKVIACGSLTGGRKDLVCVRAGIGLAVVGCDDGYVRVVSAAGGPVRECPCFVDSPDTWLTERANTVRAVDVTDDTTRAAAGTEDGRLWLIGLPAATRSAYWPAHFGRVTAVAFSPDGEWLASGGRDRDVRLWKRTEGGYEPYVTLPAGRPVRQVVFTADGQGLVVLREGDSAARVWHLDKLHKWFREAGLDG